MEEFLVTHNITIPPLQAMKDNRRNNGQCPERHECVVNTVDHLGWAGLAIARNEKRCRQSRGRDAEADRHLLHGARNGTGGAVLLVRGVGIDERIHACVLQRRKGPIRECLQHNDLYRRMKCRSPGPQCNSPVGVDDKSNKHQQDG